MTDDDEDGYEALRESFKKLMSEHPYNLTVIHDAPDQAPPTVQKAAAYLPVSDELLHPERYPAPPVTRRTRFRWWRREMQSRVFLAWDVLRHGHDCGDYL